MKQGKSLVELAQELERVKNASRDYIVPVTRLEATVTDSETPRVALTFENGEKHTSPLTTWAGTQLATYTDIPKRYFDRLNEENPTLLASNVNHAFSRSREDKRMVRTIDGTTRAFLSNRYRRLDSYDLLNEVLPAMHDNGLEVVNSEITERRMYLRALSPRIQGEVKKGDVVQYGLMLSSSDVGSGMVRVEPFMMRLVCLNGMIAPAVIKERHMARSQGEGDDITELLTDETQELTDRAFWAKVRDVVTGSMKKDYFERELEKMRRASDLAINNFDLPQVVDATVKTLGLQASDTTKNDLVKLLASGNQNAGLTQWGLVNAFTAAAEKSESFDDAVDLERAGTQILNLAPSQWKRIAEAQA